MFVTNAAVVVDHYKETANTLFLIEVMEFADIMMKILGFVQFTVLVRRYAELKSAMSYLLIGFHTMSIAN